MVRKLQFLFYSARPWSITCNAGHGELSCPSSRRSPRWG